MSDNPFISPAVLADIREKNKYFVDIRVTEGDNYVQYDLYQLYVKPATLVGRIRLTQTDLPYMVSGGLWVREGWSGPGQASGVLDSLRDATLSAGGLKNGLIASVHAGNAPELSRMFKGGWRMVHYSKERYIFIRET